MERSGLYRGLLMGLILSFNSSVFAFLPCWANPEAFLVRNQVFYHFTLFHHLFSALLSPQIEFNHSWRFKSSFRTLAGNLMRAWSLLLSFIFFCLVCLESLDLTATLACVCLSCFSSFFAFTYASMVCYEICFNGSFTCPVARSLPRRKVPQRSRQVTGRLGTWREVCLSNCAACESSSAGTTVDRARLKAPWKLAFWAT